MAQIRRVVTGHSADGKAVVLFDDEKQLVERRHDVLGADIWTSLGFPVDNEGDEDQSTRLSKATTLPGGTVCRVLELRPGHEQRVHRTNSLDYAAVLSGELDMELDDGATVHLKAGDLVVQRGTTHNWINPGPAPCRVLFVLIDASPVSVAGRTLDPFG